MKNYLHLTNRGFILILTLFSSFITTTAQISVTESQFQEIFTAGKIINSSISSIISPVNVGSISGPNVYDFSNIGLPSVIAMNCYEVSTIPKLLSRFAPNGVTFGTSPDLISTNIFLFGQDTVNIPGSVNMGSQMQIRHKSPPEILAIFPINYGYSFNQSFVNIDTFFNSQGGVISIANHNKNKTNNIDGFGSLKVGSFNFQCLRMKTLDTDGNKQFIFFTREGIAVNIDVKGSQPDTGFVQLNGISVYYTGSLSDVKNENLVQSQEYSLSQNYPNPFNPSTVIKYAVPFESNVNIRFYNSLGQIVREVNEGNRQPGNYEINFISKGLASGIYFYSLKAVSTNGKNDFSAVKKMILLK